MRVAALFCLAGALTLSAQESPSFRGWMDRGMRELQAARYPDAAAAFQKAVDLNPNDLTARMHLADAWLSQYIPGAQSPENLDIARQAENQFERVLALDGSNVAALESLASLNFQEAQGMPDREKKSRKLDEAAARYERLVAVDPRNKTAYYSIGVIDWAQWYPNYFRARTDLGMEPQSPGPLRDAAVRHRLLQQYGSQIEHGLSNLQRALDIDPGYSDAMAYMNLLIRERADLRDSSEEYRRETKTADDWVGKALEARRSGATTQAGIQGRMVEAPPPPPPPPPAVQAAPSSSSITPERIRISGDAQAQKLIRKVEAGYPPLAKQARIQGTVRFIAIVARDGTVQNIQLVSGHPLLVESARQAVNRYVYQPTLLNGELVEVVTQIDVNFSLGLQLQQ
jgi:TonB family protein